VTGQALDARVRLNPSPTEITTAATDAALALLCLMLLVSLLRRSTRFRLKRAIWVSVFACLGAGSALGAIAHGLDLSPSVRAALWRPLYLSLGLTVALFLVGGVADWRGERAARAILPWSVAVGVAFFLLTQVAGGGFGLFIVYEGIAMAATLAVYLYLWVVRGRAGAATVALGVALTLAAAAVQASSLSMRIIWPFDHNGLFHLVQMIAVLVMAGGLRRGMNAAHDVPGASSTGSSRR
jgi:hypothetical protein